MEEEIVKKPVRKRGPSKSDLERLKDVTHKLIPKLLKLATESKHPLDKETMERLFGAKATALSVLEALTDLKVKQENAARTLGAVESTSSAPPDIAAADIALIQDFLSKIRRDLHDPLV